MARGQRTALRRIVAQAEQHRLTLLAEALAGDGAWGNGWQGGLRLGLLMFYGEAFERIQVFAAAPACDPLIARVAEVATLGAVTFSVWRVSQTSLCRPCHLVGLARHWEQIVTLCGIGEG